LYDVVKYHLWFSLKFYSVIIIQFASPQVGQITQLQFIEAQNDQNTIRYFTYFS